ncbi:unnamed protein product, partial [Symbiodinium sp. CCMP2592]
DFLRHWLSSSGDERVWCRLRRGAELAGIYNQATVPGLKQVLGSLWTEADKYCTPSEVLHQLTDGVLKEDSRFHEIRQMLQQCHLRELCQGTVLFDALTHVDRFRTAQSGALMCFLLLSMEKASTIFCCTHSDCPIVHYDSHCYDLQDLSTSATTLASSGAELLDHLTTRPDAMYKANAAASLWVLSRPWSQQCCAAPSVAALRGCLTENAGARVSAQLSVKTEAAPSAVVGQEVFARAMGTQIISLEQPVTPPPKPKATPETAQKDNAPRRPVKVEPSSQPLPVKLEPSDPQPRQLVLVDDDNEPAAAPKLPSRRVRKAQKQERLAGRSELDVLGIDYHNVFGPKHKFVMPKNHWKDFCRAVSLGKEVECPICTELRRQARTKQEPAADEDTGTGVAEITDIVAAEAPGVSAATKAFQERFQRLREEEGMLAIKKGRRPKSGGPVPLHENLWEWLKVRRPEQYTSFGGHKIQLQCELCKEKFHAMRPNTIYFVLQHEAQSLHWEAQRQQQRPQCEGLRLEHCNPVERTFAHDVAQCFLLWAQHDCPWHMQQYQAKCIVGEDGIVVVRSAKCTKQKQTVAPGCSACRSCMGLCRTADFCSKVATWAYRIDMAKFVAAIFLENDVEISRLMESMTEASWQKFHPTEMESLRDMRYADLYDALQNLLVKIPNSLRNQAMQRFMITHFDWLPRQIAKPQLDKSSTGQALDYVDILLRAKSVKASQGNDARLCQQILSGALDGNAVARAMVTGILHKAEKVSQGKSRVCTSSLPGIEPSAIAEVGFALSSCTRQESLMKMFGMIAPQQKGVDVWQDHLPLFFSPATSSPVAGGISQLEKNARLVLSIFGQQCQETRDYMIAFDETTYWPQYNLQAFPDPIGMAYVGGADDRAVLPASQHSPGTLLKTQLCQTCVSYLLKRASTRKEPFDVCMAPKRQSSVNTQSVMALTGSVWQSVTAAAGGIPPISQSCDNHPSQTRFNALFLGQLSADDVRGIPFFEECAPLRRSCSVPCYRFKSLTFRTHVIFGHNDAAHTQKCLTRAWRAKTRTLYNQGLRVCHQSLLLRGLPTASFRGNDSQSDVEAAWLLCPSLLDLSQWDSLGIGMAMYCIALTTGCWLSSHRFTPQALLENSLCGYFLLLLDIKDAAAKPDQFYHSITIANQLATCGHLLERMFNWPKSTPFRPSATMEDTCEHHFGKLSAPDKKKISEWSAMSDAEVEAISRQAFETVCQFKAVVSVGRDWQSYATDLETWWQVTGRAMVGTKLKTTGVEDDCSENGSDAADEVPDVTEVEVDQGADIAQTLACLEKEAETLECIEASIKDAQTESITQATPDVDQNQETDDEKPCTLKQILAKSGFDKYAPPQPDSEDCMLLRLRKLLPDMLKVVCETRLGEGFLRPSQIREGKRPLSEWNRMQKELSEAQRSFGLRGVRQGRAAAWWGFAKLVAQAAQDEACKFAGLAGHDVVFCAPESFRPSNALKSGVEPFERDYQILVVRLHQLGRNHLALVERVFRGSVNRKGGTGNKPHESTLPAQQTSCLHVSLFAAVEPETDGMYKTTVLSPAVVIQPHNSQPEKPTVLFEVCRQHFETRPVQTALLMQLSPAALAGIKSIKADTLAVAASEQGHKPDNAEVFTESSFSNTKQGLENIVKYMSLLPNMFQKVTGQSLTLDDGRVRPLRN